MSLRATYIPGVHNRSRHSVETGAEARGIEAPPRGGGVDMEGVRPGTSGSVCVLRDVSLSTLVLPHASSSSWTGRDGADVAEASSVCISLDCSAPGCPGESSPGPGSTTFIAPWWPGRVWFPDIISLFDGPPPELPVRRDLLSRVGGSRVHPNENHGNCGLGLLALNRGCRDHSPLQSSLHEETLCLEVESFTS